MTHVEPEAMVWKPCPTCWGQRRIIEDGMWILCWTCLGVGDVQSVEIRDEREAA